MTRQTIRIRVFFDAGSGICLWAGNEAARAAYGDYPIPPEKLSISDHLHDRIGQLTERYDESIDWNDPIGPTPWTEEECSAFHRAVFEMIEELIAELGPPYEIVNEFIPLSTATGQTSPVIDAHPRPQC